MVPATPKKEGDRRPAALDSIRVLRRYGVGFPWPSFDPCHGRARNGKDVRNGLSL
jgi:hypothetical protein